MEDTTTLSPEDVPGAILACSDVQDNSVRELKRWLECRGLKRTGRKDELVSRVENCIAMGRDGDLFVGVDGGKWYDLKRAQVAPLPGTCSRALEHTTTKTLNYEPFPSVEIPIYFNKGHIYSYIIEGIVDQNDEYEYFNESTNTTEKPFRKAEQFVDSGYLENVMDTSDGQCYYITCKCHASFKDKSYTVLVKIRSASGAVLSGTCECVQSSMGKCSHVTALLEFLWRHVKEVGYNAGASSCTSQLRQWGLGSKRREPGNINTQEYAVKRFQPLARTKFDPRPQVYERMDSFNSLLVDLQNCEGEPTLFEVAFEVIYEDFQYSAEEIQDFKELVSQFQQNISDKLSLQLVELCSDQQTDQWKLWRSYFLTGSIVKRVVTMSKPSTRTKFLRDHLWSLEPQIETEAMAYGKMNEKNAEESYVSTLSSNESMKHFGLLVNRKYEYLAASVDGAVEKDGKLLKVVEYKCPHMLAKCHPSKFYIYLSKLQLNNFFLKMDGSEIKLKPKHAYAYQVALYMLVLEVDECNIVVWSPLGFIIVKVFKTNLEEECENILKLKSFYYNVYVPEYFSMRTVRMLSALEINYI